MHKLMCIYSPHHISTALNGAHTQPPFLSDGQSQNLSQHIFYTMLRKTLSGFCTDRNPRRGLSARAHRALDRVREKEESSANREAACFSQKSRRASYYLQSFMWSKGLFLSSAKEVLLLLFQSCFCSVGYYSNACLSVSDGGGSFGKDNNSHAHFNNWIEKARDHLPHEKYSVSMIAIKSMSSQGAQM